MIWLYDNKRILACESRVIENRISAKMVETKDFFEMPLDKFDFRGEMLSKNHFQFYIRFYDGMRRVFHPKISLNISQLDGGNTQLRIQIGIENVIAVVFLAVVICWLIVILISIFSNDPTIDVWSISSCSVIVVVFITALFSSILGSKKTLTNYIEDI